MRTDFDKLEDGAPTCLKCGAECDGDELSAAVGADVLCEPCMAAWERKHQTVLDALNSPDVQAAIAAADEVHNRK